jgi:hypothetical protein
LAAPAWRGLWFEREARERGDAREGGWGRGKRKEEGLTVSEVRPGAGAGGVPISFALGFLLSFCLVV